MAMSFTRCVTHSFSSSYKPTHHHCALFVHNNLRCSAASFESALPNSNAGINVVGSDTKKAAMDVGSGSALVAFYSDHHGIPMTASEEALLDKCRAIRVLLESDAPFQTLLTTVAAPLASYDELCLVYDERYIQGILNGDWSENKLQPFGFPWSDKHLARSRASTGGAVAAMHLVMTGLRSAASSIGGDVLSSHMEGCTLVPSGVFNDVAVAASVAMHSYPKLCNANRPILVIDLDVCQRTDTVRLFENENRVVTFNLHGPNNAPWQTNHRRGNDSGLLDCTGDEYYLAILAVKIEQLFDFFNPGLVFFQAGVDALSEDTSGKLSMTRQGLIHRNNIVYTACFYQKIPLVITMGAGYSKPFQACIEAYADVYRSAALRYGSVQNF